MTAKEFLRRARGLDRRVDEANERLERLRARIEAGRLSQITGMPRGGASDWTETASLLIDMEREINAKVREMVRGKRLAMQAIEAVEEIRYREVLELYYLDGFTWEQVAEQMDMSDRHVKRLHGKALLKIKVPDEMRKENK